MYLIHLTPRNTAFPPHIWQEGGNFYSHRAAHQQAKQIRQLRDMYSKVEVKPTNGWDIL